MALVSQVFYCFYHDELSRFQRTLTEIVLIFFRLVFTEVFSVDFRTCSIKGSFTSFERIICVFVLMPYACSYASCLCLSLWKRHFQKLFLLVNWILLSLFESTKPKYLNIFKSSHPEVFLGKGILKICGKFTGEHPCRSVISIKLQSSFIEITLRHGCSPVNMLHIFRTCFSQNASGRLFLYFAKANFC